MGSTAYYAMALYNCVLLCTIDFCVLRVLWCTVFVFEYTARARNIVTVEKILLFYVVVIIPWMLISIFGLNAKTKNLQLIAVSLLLFLYLFNSSFTFLESSSLTK